jgi:hypothetical protein
VGIVLALVTEGEIKEGMEQSYTKRTKEVVNNRK